MDTFLVIMRNAIIILLSLTVFAAAGVGIGTFFSDNSYEPH